MRFQVHHAWSKAVNTLSLSHAALHNWNLSVLWIEQDKFRICLKKFETYTIESIKKMCFWWFCCIGGWSYDAHEDIKLNHTCPAWKVFDLWTGTRIESWDGMTWLSISFSRHIKYHMKPPEIAPCVDSNSSKKRQWFFLGIKWARLDDIQVRTIFCTTCHRNRSVFPRQTIEVHSQKPAMTVIISAHPQTSVLASKCWAGSC